MAEDKGFLEREDRTLVGSRGHRKAGSSLEGRQGLSHMLGGSQAQVSTLGVVTGHWRQRGGRH